MWDRVIMGEFDLLVYTLISYLESFKEDQFKLLNDVRLENLKQIRKINLIDESKIFKRAIKYYRQTHATNSNSNVFNLIINYLSNSI